MATPAKSVQIRDADSLCKIYERMDIPAWAIKQGNDVNWKYEGSDMSEGASQLRAYCEMLMDNETAAIYKLCLYEELEGKITDKTPVSLSNNFRFNDGASYGSPDHYGGNYGAILGEVKELRKQLTEMKNQAPEENRLGIIGELMELEPMQPILMGVATKIADWIMTPGKGVGELKRVSGVPGAAGSAPIPSPGMVGNWRENPVICQSLDVLQGSVQDLPGLLEKLAAYAVKKPKQFEFYQTMLFKTKL
jgi:hypothetical protein